MDFTRLPPRVLRKWDHEFKKTHHSKTRKQPQSFCWVFFVTKPKDRHTHTFTDGLVFSRNSWYWYVLVDMLMGSACFPLGWAYFCWPDFDSEKSLFEPGHDMGVLVQAGIFGHQNAYYHQCHQWAFHHWLIVQWTALLSHLAGEKRPVTIAGDGKNIHCWWVLLRHLGQKG